MEGLGRQDRGLRTELGHAHGGGGTLLLTSRVLSERGRNIITMIRGKDHGYLGRFGEDRFFARCSGVLKTKERFHGKR